MKTLLTLLFLLLNVFALTAQDLIVNSAGDSLNVKITRVKAGYIYYNYKAGRQVRSALFPPDSVTFYQLDFYPYAAVPSGKVITRGEISNWVVGINGGFSWMTPATDPTLGADEKKYLNGLASGYHLGGNVNYFFNGKIGVGIVYNAFLTSNSVLASATFPTQHYPDSITKYGKLSEHIMINYIGPSFNFRRISRKNTNVMSMAASIGYTGYRDNLNFLPDPSLSFLPDTTIHIKLTSSTVGLNFDFGYDFGISKHLAIGAGIALRIAVLDTVYETENGRTEKIVLDQYSYQSLARADVYLGLRFR